ncbi:MAG: hypothetical protein AB7G75_16960 [Candidatus Binatia bacterium]
MARSPDRSITQSFQRFHQHQNLRRHAVVQLRRISQAAVAAAGDDGLQGADKGARMTRQVGIGSELLKEGHGGRRVTSE